MTQYLLRKSGSRVREMSALENFERKPTTHNLKSVARQSPAHHNTFVVGHGCGEVT